MWSLCFPCIWEKQYLVYKIIGLKKSAINIHLVYAFQTFNTWKMWKPAHNFCGDMNLPNLPPWGETLHVLHWNKEIAIASIRNAVENHENGRAITDIFDWSW